MILDRRAFLGTVGLLAAPRIGEPQSDIRVRRIGVLDLASAASEMRMAERLRSALREKGWIEGKNISFDAVWADGRAERLPALAAELIKRKADVIVTGGTTAIIEARKATSTVPIVMIGGDPVGTGVVQSLARPGGNVTGVSLVGQELMEKHLDVLRHALPRMRSVTLLRAAANPGNPFFLEHMTAAGKRLGVRVTAIDILEPGELDAAFGRIVSDTVFMLLDPMFFIHRDRIAALAIHRRLPLMTADRRLAAAGFFMSYGPNPDEVTRLVASFVDRILRGANAGDLPVEQPTKFDLVINLKTAKALGLTIPPSLLQRADQVLE